MMHSAKPASSTLYLSIAALLVAQASGLRMSIGDQLFMMFTLMVTSKGVVCVPRAAFVILAGALTTFHMPLKESLSGSVSTPF